ncbi:MAG: IclR family transcriptional regulator [Kiritimatiellae bacterium]|nr:IclR family transcriptional regulator [Kiritimatiellia bacterium]
MIQSLDRAIKILDILAESSPETVSPSVLAGRLGLSPQTVGNILRELYSQGMVSQDGSRRYRLGSHCFYLGQVADHWQTLREQSRPILKELRDATGNSVFLGVIENDKLLCLSLLQRGDDFFSFPPQNWADQLHSTASGRLLVALMDTESRRRLLRRIQRRQVTSQTVTDATRLEELCEGIAADRYAEVRDESVEGTWSLAVPVTTPNGEVLAALALSDHQSAYGKMDLKSRLELLFASAARIGVAATFRISN